MGNCIGKCCPWWQSKPRNASKVDPKTSHVIGTEKIVLSTDEPFKMTPEHPMLYPCSERSHLLEGQNVTNKVEEPNDRRPCMEAPSKEINLKSDESNRGNMSNRIDEGSIDRIIADENSDKKMKILVGSNNKNLEINQIEEKFKLPEQPVIEPPDDDRQGSRKQIEGEYDGLADAPRGAKDKMVGEENDLIAGAAAVEEEKELRDSKKSETNLDYQMPDRTARRNHPLNSMPEPNTSIHSDTIIHNDRKKHRHTKKSLTFNSRQDSISILRKTLDDLKYYNKNSKNLAIIHKSLRI